MQASRHFWRLLHARRFNVSKCDTTLVVPNAALQCSPINGRHKICSAAMIKQTLSGGFCATWRILSTLNQP